MEECICEIDGFGYKIYDPYCPTCGTLKQKGGQEDERK